jgi:hypothetical protein
MMSSNRNRRDVLKSLTTLAAASSVSGTMTPSVVRAAGAAPALSPALGQVTKRSARR